MFRTSGARFASSLVRPAAMGRARAMPLCRMGVDTSRGFATKAVATTEEEQSTLPVELRASGPAWTSTMALVGAGIVMNQEMYVVNDETMLAASWLGLMFVFVKGGSGAMAEMLDARSALIEEELTQQRTEEVEAVKGMMEKAEDAIAVNKELVSICSPANFEEWTKFKMEKTLQMTANEAAMQTLAKVEAVKKFEEQSARRKMISIVAAVNAGVEAQLASNKELAKSSIDDAIAGIATAQ